MKKIVILSFVTTVIIGMENPQLGTTPPIIATLSSATPIACVSYSADGKTLVLAGANNMQIWDTGDFSKPQRIVQGNDFINSVDINPNNSNFAAGGHPLDGNRGVINIMDLQMGATTKILSDSKAIETVQYLQSGTALLSASDNGSCKIWDLKASHQSYKNYDVKAGGAWCANLNPADTNMFAAVYENDNTVAVWDIRKEDKPVSTICEQVPCVLVRFNNEGKLLVGGEYIMMLRDQKLKLLATYTMQGEKVPSNQGVKVPIGKVPVQANSFKFMPGNPNLVIAAIDNDQMLFMDLENSKNSFEFAVPDKLAAQGVDINPDGKSMAVGCWGAKTLIYNISDINALKAKLKEKTEPVERVKVTAAQKVAKESGGGGWPICGYQ